MAFKNIFVPIVLLLVLGWSVASADTNLPQLENVQSAVSTLIDTLPKTEHDALSLADRVITYKKVDRQELKLHVYLPGDLQLGDLRAAILFIHGGGWIKGAPSVHALESLYFSRRGLVTVTIL